MAAYLLSLLLFLQTNPTGTVTGIVRNAAGMPAAGVRVYAISAADPKEAGNVARALEGLNQTDEAGRFRLEVSAGRYVIGAGSVASPTYAPGTSDLTRARVVSITSTAIVENVDISGYVTATNAQANPFMVIPPGATGVLSGVIRNADATPASGLYVGAAPASILNSAAGMQNALKVAAGNLSLTPRLTRTDANGRYRLENLAADTYYIMAGFANSFALYPGVTDIASASTVATTPTTSLDTLNFITAVRGKILWEDGTAFSDAQSIGEVGLVTGTKPNATLTTLFPLDASGRFGRTMPEGDYHLFLRTLPDEYSIRSITAGGVDLLKETLKVAIAAVDIEVRLSRRMNPTGTRIRGRVLEGVTGKPAVAETVMLCCQEGGPVYRIATRVREDGSFEFIGVAPGVYSALLQSRTTPELVDHSIAVADADVDGITLVAAAELVAVPTRIVSEDGNLAAASGITITFTGVSGLTPIAAVVAGNPDHTVAWVPAGDRYTVAVQRIPDGYVLKAIGGGDGTLLTGGHLAVVKGSIPSLTVRIGRK